MLFRSRQHKLPFMVKKLIVIATPYVDGSLQDGKGKVTAPFGTNTDLSELGGKVEHIVIMHSKDDFVVPYEHALKYKAALPEATLLTFEDKNHFLVEELPELLQKIREINKT